jgi:uncharacterized protein YecT (DUF1311 family)
MMGELIKAVARIAVPLLLVGCKVAEPPRPSDDFLDSCLVFSTDVDDVGEMRPRDLAFVIGDGEMSGDTDTANWRKVGDDKYILHRSVDGRAAHLDWLESGSLGKPPPMKFTETADAAASRSDPESELYSHTYHKCMAAGDARIGVTVAMLDCLGAEHDIQDARLNQTYKRLMARLDQEARDKLRQEQRAWLKRRDSKCASNANGGTAETLSASGCFLSETAQQAAVLETLEHSLD